MSLLINMNLRPKNNKTTIPRWHGGLSCMFKENKYGFFMNLIFSDVKMRPVLVVDHFQFSDP